MSTISITIPQPLRQFVTEKVTELGLHQPEEYFVRLAEEKQKEELWAYYEKEVGKAIDNDVWLTAEEVREHIRIDREKRRQARQARKEQ